MLFLIIYTSTFFGAQSMSNFLWKIIPKGRIFWMTYIFSCTIGMVILGFLSKHFDWGYIYMGFFTTLGWYIEKENISIKGKLFFLLLTSTITLYILGVISKQMDWEYILLGISSSILFVIEAYLPQIWRSSKKGKQKEIQINEESKQDSPIDEEFEKEKQRQKFEADAILKARAK